MVLPMLLVVVSVPRAGETPWAPSFFPFKACTFYGPKSANANYPTFIKEKVGHLPSLGRGVEQRSVEPGYGSRTRCRMMESFLPRGPVSHAKKKKSILLNELLVIESNPPCIADSLRSLKLDRSSVYDASR